MCITNRNKNRILHLKNVFTCYVIVFKLCTSPKSFLPAETKLWPRLCFCSCLWFCSRRGGLPQCMLGYHLPPGKQTPPPWRKHSLGRKHPPRHTVNEQPVRILLECILVKPYFHRHWIRCQPAAVNKNSESVHVNNPRLPLPPLNTNVYAYNEFG